MSKTTTLDLSDETIGELESFEYVEVLGRDLRVGMLLVDRDLGTPVYFLDHRQARTSARSAGGRWFVFDYEAGAHGKWQDVTLLPTSTFPVATARIVD